MTDFVLCTVGAQSILKSSFPGAIQCQPTSHLRSSTLKPVANYLENRFSSSPPTQFLYLSSSFVGKDVKPRTTAGIKRNVWQTLGHPWSRHCATSGSWLITESRQKDEDRLVIRAPEFLQRWHGEFLFSVFGCTVLIEQIEIRGNETNCNPWLKLSSGTRKCKNRQDSPELYRKQ